MGNSMLITGLKTKVELFARFVNSVDGQILSRGHEPFNNSLVFGFKTVEPNRQANISEGDVLRRDEILELLLANLVLFGVFRLSLFHGESTENCVEFLRV